MVDQPPLVHVQHIQYTVCTYSLVCTTLSLELLASGHLLNEHLYGSKRRGTSLSRVK